MKLSLAASFIALVPALVLAQPAADVPKAAPVEPVLAKYHAGNGRLGIRLGVDAKTGLPQIISLIRSGSAEYYGLKVGDVLVRIDKNMTNTLTMDEVSLALRGPVGSAVEVSYQRDDNPKYFSVALKREAITQYQIDMLNPPTIPMYRTP